MKRLTFLFVASAITSTSVFVACKPSAPNLIGKWDGTGPELFHCVLDISRTGDNYAIKTQNFTPGGSGRCDFFDGIYTMTEEGNLSRGAEGAVLSFDKNKNQLSNFAAFHEWLYFTRSR